MLDMGFEEMTKTERVMAAVAGDEVDLYSGLLRHHFQPARSARRMAEATLDFFEATFDLDIIESDALGTALYPFPRKSIRDVNDWTLISGGHRSRFFNQRAVSIQALAVRRDGKRRSS